MSWLDRNAPFQLNIGDEWPLSSKYTDRGVSDAEVAGLLVDSDTDFSQGLCELQFLTTDSTGAISHLCYNLYDDDRVLEEYSAGTKWLIASVRQQRHFGVETKSHLGLDRRRWYNLLKKLHVPCPAIELLHDNNGGFGAFFSFDRPPKGASSRDSSKSNRPDVFHIFMKPSDCQNSENFLYARHDYNTDQKVVLHAGTNGDQIMRKVKARLQHHPSSSIFHIVFAALSVCYYVIENTRWSVDESVQEVDVKMPHSGFAQVAFEDDIHELDTTKLSLEEGIAWPRNSVQKCVKSATILDRILIFVEQQLWRHAHFQDNFDPQRRPLVLQMALENMSNALLLKSSQCQAQIVQMEGLKTRIDTQFNMITALVAQRDSATNVEIARAMQADSEINIEIATSMQRDSKLMRGIAFVTMAFLPATTFATFFSMDFFSVSFPTDDQTSTNESTFSVSKWLWVYFICTVPFTIMLIWEYGMGDWLRPKFSKQEATDYHGPARSNQVDRHDRRTRPVTGRKDQAATEERGLAAIDNSNQV